MTLRRARDGRLLLSYPQRVARDGSRHAIVRPIDDQARRKIEVTIFETLGIDAGV